MKGDASTRAACCALACMRSCMQAMAVPRRPRRARGRPCPALHRMGARRLAAGAYPRRYSLWQCAPDSAGDGAVHGASDRAQWHEPCAGGGSVPMPVRFRHDAAIATLPAVFASGVRTVTRIRARPHRVSRSCARKRRRRDDADCPCCAGAAGLCAGRHLVLRAGAIRQRARRRLYRAGRASLTLRSGKRPCQRHLTHSTERTANEP